MELVAEDLVAGYGTGPVIEVARFELRPGAISAVIGLNGSGKSTLFKACCGLATIFHGTVFAKEADGGSVSKRDVAKHIWYLPQRDYVFRSLTIREHLRLVTNSGSVVLNQQSCPLNCFEKQFPIWRTLLDKRGSELSGGEQKIAALGVCLASGQRVVLLDEPSAGVWELLARELSTFMRARISNAGVALGIIDHRLDIISEIADFVYVMNSGRLDGPYSANAAISALEGALT